MDADSEWSLATLAGAIEEMGFESSSKGSGDVDDGEADAPVGRSA